MTDREVWHVGRRWSDHVVEDECPCPQEPCGLVDPLKASVRCTEHQLGAAKTIRQSHLAQDCPGATR